MLETIGGILGGLGQLAGGAAGLFGGGGNNNNFYNQLAVMREQAQLQREFAQNGIRWKVEDAKAAGIHPLYALGGSGASYSPSAVSVGSDTESSLGRDLANMGQGLGRAVAASASKEDRADAAYQSQLRIMGLERASLENRLLETQIAASQSALMRGQIGPGIPTGRSVAGDPSHVIKPAEITASASGMAGIEAGPQQPGNRYVAMTPDGRTVAALPSKDMNFEELSTPGTASWQFWNTVLPFLSEDARNASRPPKSMLPKGTNYWEWTPLGYRARYAPPYGWLPRRPGASAYTGPRASTGRFSPSGAER